MTARPFAALAAVALRDSGFVLDIVAAPTGHRRVLIVEGAPGFEHTFLLRALTQDPGLLVTALEDRLHQDVRLAAVPAVQGDLTR